jgi:hypothetical protein
VRSTALLLLLLAALGPLVGLRSDAAQAATVARTPVEDVGFPFWCDWSYDWEARCYRDFGPRLPVGGVDDKVWRSGLRFSLRGIPTSAVVTSAKLKLTFDGVCVAPRLTSIACPGDRFVLDAYPIASADWYHEREPEYYWTVEDEASLDTGFAPQKAVWDLTALTRDWLAGRLENNGVLLKLADGLEDFEVGGPYFPSANAADAAVRPRLVIRYWIPTGVAR